MNSYSFCAIGKTYQYLIFNDKYDNVYLDFAYQTLLSERLWVVGMVLGEGGKGRGHRIE